MSKNKTPSGSFIKWPKWYDAFLPKKLPPKLVWDKKVTEAFNHANILLGELALEWQRSPNPHLLTQHFMTKEAFITNKLNEASQIPEDVQKVHNYIKAFDLGLISLQNGPLTLNVIKELHIQLMQNTRDSVDAGAFRCHLGWIGAEGSTLSTARFIPPPPEYVIDCLEALEKFLSDRNIPSLIHMGLCHYQFLTIHPFRNGNGRTIRILNTLQFIEHNLLPAPLLNFSEIIMSKRNEYADHLFNVSEKGMWNEWLLFFLDGVGEQARVSLEQVRRLNALT